MIQETYCSFEQAKALKELGFPQGSSDHYYDDEGNTLVNFESICGEPINWSEWIVMPTLSLVQKWLREEKNISTEVNASAGFGKEDKWRVYYCIRFVDMQPNGCWSEYEDRVFRIGTETYKMFETYEEALSAGIDKCIELLKHHY